MWGGLLVGVVLNGGGFRRKQAIKLVKIIILGCQP